MGWGCVSGKWEIAMKEPEPIWWRDRLKAGLSIWPKVPAHKPSEEFVAYAWMDGEFREIPVIDRRQGQ
jgi:hypothetical protein